MHCIYCNQFYTPTAEAEKSFRKYLETVAEDL